MALKARIKDKALELGFVDAGFTGVEPLDDYIKEIESRPEMYQWTMNDDFNPLRGATPTTRSGSRRRRSVRVREGPSVAHGGPIQQDQSPMSTRLRVIL